MPVKRFSLRTIALFSISLITLFGVFFAFQSVSAQGDTFGVNRVGENLPLGNEDIRVIIAKIIRVFLSLLGIIAVGLMLYAGFTWMTAGGNEDKVATAKKILINATIGLAIVMGSFAITQFVLKSLQGATGGVVDNENGNRAGGGVPCNNFAECQALNGPRECADEGFVVKSLTPQTPQNNATGISNVVVRAVFSRPLDQNQNTNKILTLTKNGNPIDIKNVRILEGRQVVEAFFSEDTALCNANGENTSCLSEGNYQIEVNPDLTVQPDAALPPLPLQTRLSCGEFSNRANFSVNRDFLDAAGPEMTGYSINGKRETSGVALPRGRKYTLNATFNDRRKDDAEVSFGGFSYLRLRVESIPSNPDAERADWTYVTGPKSGSNESFTFNQGLDFPIELAVPALYNFTFETSDIDSNQVIATSSFVLDGELCHNGRQDPGETGVDIGGACLSDGACNADWQCLSGQCGENGQCINRPVIRDIDVGGRDAGAWNAAPGSWITILGNFFGSEVGGVDFGIDQDNDGVVDQWREAALASCNGLDVWKDRSIIVAVPDLPVGTSTTIRIRTAAVGETPSYEDLSTDDAGPKPGPNQGIFQISENEHPGLCAVFGPNNAQAASSTVAVTAFGKNLGNGANSSLLFGSVNAPVQQWGDDLILSSVPQNMQPGRVGIRAKIGDDFTNSVEFLVVGDNEAVLPQIQSITPSPVTPGSLVTLTGGPFGAFGTVYLAPTKEAALECARTTDPNVEAACTRLDLQSLPDACGNTWSDNQIVGKIPLGLAIQSYTLVVKNEAGYASNGENTLELRAGDPLPGLCRLEPNRGVAPLRAVDQPLKLTGIGLSNPTLYFWTVGAEPNNKETWLDSTRHRDPQGRNVIDSVSNNGTSIRAFLPVNADGISMITGPIQVASGGAFSNSLSYTVNDCTLGGTPPGPNYQCCSTGPEKGIWKPQEFACIGESKSAGYVWRFTTGLIPQVPRVVEACQVEDWNNNNVNTFVRPSPSPWENWRVGDACTDSVITVQFSMHMAPGNLRENIRVYTCGNEDAADCEYDADQDVTANYVPVLLPGQENILELRPVAGAPHIEGTWHRVILGSALRANEAGLREFGRDVINNRELATQRPLPNRVDGLTVAYHFDFKTGSNRCNLFGAAITPNTYTARLLGVLQNPGYPVSTNFDNPPFPFYYYVWGRGTQACSVVDVNGKGWQWKPRENVAADPGFSFAFTQKQDNTNVAVTSSEYYKDVRASVHALQNTQIDPVYITASTNTVVEGVQKTVVGTSTLYIDLGEPRAVEWWPQCNESCTNATIGVRFNRPMVTSTYRTAEGSAIKVQKCIGIGENCVNLDPAEGLPTTDINPGAFDPFQYSVSVIGSLELGKLYQVSVSDQIRSLARYSAGSAVFGKPLIPKVWKFKTKMQDGICILDKVDVVPNPFIARLVGEKTPFAASPMSSPDQCSPYGQRLNPWGYGWNWTVASTSIATVSALETKGNPPAYCNAQCLPVGSAIPLGQNAYACGNQVVDPGEDCDIARGGETVGVSCTLNCLRPGNTNATGTVSAVPGLCGNGIVENSFGEECDPGLEEMKPYCSSICTWKGSADDFSEEIGDLQCGNGRVGLLADGGGTLGEECDINLSLEEATANNAISAAGIGCSSQCLHVGTRLSRQYCEGTADLDIKNSVQCQNAITVCGNQKMELGEECEHIDATHIKIKNARGVEETVEVEDAAAVCSNRCVLKNICDIKDQIYSDFTCESGTLGCSTGCTRLGSSPLYDTPSLCGNGRPETGENPLCDSNQAFLDAASFGQDPVQVVTAVGEGSVNSSTLRQETTVDARAVSIRPVATTTLENGALTPRALPADKSITGQGQYAIQCGYVEYETPEPEGEFLRFNNCPESTHGVGNNSCCQVRGSRVASYPLHGAGINQENKVCLNTYIETTFDREIDDQTLAGNILLASVHPADYNCAQNDQNDVTQEVNQMLALSGDVGSNRLFAKFWNEMKEFFAALFSYVVHAAAPGGLQNQILDKVSGRVWCSGAVQLRTNVISQKAEDGTQATSTVGMYISDALQENTVYAVILRGGKNGIQDVRGVGIRGDSFTNNQERFKKDDIFIFETGSELCRIDSISVTPDKQLFVTPQQSQDFRAEARTENGDRIVTTTAYNWNWNWQPATNSIFTFNPPLDTEFLTIASKNVEGHILASAQAIVTQDQSERSNHVGRGFSGTTDLTALFCENPWPSRSTYPYEDRQGNDDGFNTSTGRFEGSSIPGIFVGDSAQYVNFGMGYCADAGESGDKTDDLPRLEPLVFGELVTESGPVRIGDLSDGTLKKFLFFNDKNDDVIGVQVFANPDRLSAREWYATQNFGGAENYTDVVIDGYDAFTDGNSYYINGLNELSDGRIHNYIYLFAINENAQGNTRQVFERLLASLTLNVNIPERNLCFTDASPTGQFLPDQYKTAVVSDVFCTNDYACRTSEGTPTSSTNGICANAKTKFQRDWTRLNMVKTMQTALETYKQQNATYPDLQAGTYIPGYTNAHWPSWGRLLDAVGNVGNDPVNQWSQCTGVCEQLVEGQSVACSDDAECVGENNACILPDDPQTCWSTASLSFICPQKSNVFEYQASGGADYQLYLPLEYFNPNRNSQRQIITQFVSTTHYNSTQSCGVIQGAGRVTAAAGACGNGVLNAGEQCDPPGTSVRVADFACVEPNSAGFSLCNSNCQLEAPSCLSLSNCGNGRVEGNEVCDDGLSNNTYGFCNNTCSGPTNAFCGNGRVDTQDGRPLEQCDVADPQFVGQGFCRRNPGQACVQNSDCWGGDRCIATNDPSYHIRSNRLIEPDRLASCAQNCQGVGGFCGDGKLQAEYELCDDGNTNNLDGCSQYCQVENLACKNAIPPGIGTEYLTRDTHDPNRHDLLIHLTYDENIFDACVNTNPTAICAGYGLTCQSVARNPAGEEGSNNWISVARGCDLELTKNLGQRIRIHCDGMPQNQQVAAVEIPGSCGNGREEEGEACDLGDQNGVLCTPEYGKSCTYCSFDCREVLSRDPIGVCGNGKIDVVNNDPANPVVEVCDTNAEGQVVFAANLGIAQYDTLEEANAAFNRSTSVMSCPADNSHIAVGSVQCVNNCQVLDTSNCAACGSYDNQGKSIPKLSVLNVLTPQSNNPNSVWAGATSRKLYRNTNTDVSGQVVDAKFMCGTDRGWTNAGAGLEIVYTTNTPRCHGESTKNVLECIRREVAPGKRPDGHRRYKNAVNLSNYSAPQWICIDENGYPYDRDYGYEVVTNANQNNANNDAAWEWGEYTEQVTGIESNALCSGKYSVFFNEYELRSHPDTTGYNMTGQGYKRETVSAMKKYGSFFPYPVNGEARNIQNELVVSPAVPQGTFRVVVKWNKAGVGDNIAFTGLVYNREFLAENRQENASNQERLQGSVSYLRAKTGNLRNRDKNYLCTQMESNYKLLNLRTREERDRNRANEVFNYWIPFGCDSFVGQGKLGTVMVHERGNLTNTAAQAITINTIHESGSPLALFAGAHYDAPYAFFVQPILATTSLPISAFDGMDVTVEVYDYHDEQIAESSLYLPRETFKLRNATPSVNGGLVKYWHVFNIIRNPATGKYEIKPVRDSESQREYQQGRSVTGFADLLCGVPGEPCRRDEGF